MNKKISDYTESSGFWIALISTISILYLASFYNRYIQIDENFFAEQGYWLLNEGTVRIKSIPGVLGWDTKFYVYHKLLVWISSGITFLFGWSIFNLKAFTLLIFISFLIVLWLYIKKEGTNLAWIAVFIFISIPYILIKSFEFRPEVLMMFFTFSSFICIDKYFKTSKSNALLIAGFLAGIAFLVHLNAVIACVAGALTLVVKKDLKGAVIFSIAAIPICLIYFFPLLINNQMEPWFFELKNWPTHNFENQVTQGISGTLVHIGDKLLNEQKRFFWDEKVMIVSVLFFLSLIFSARKLWAQYNTVFIYLIILILSMAVLGSHVAPRYLLMYLPFMVLIISLTYKNSGTLFRGFFFVLSAAQLIVLVNTEINILERSTSYGSASKELMSALSKTRTSVLGPWELIFNEIENHEIYNFKTYEYQEDKNKSKYTQLQVLEDVNKREVEFIVLDEQMKNDKIFHWFKDWNVVSNPYYEEYSRTEDYLILKRIEN